MATIEFTYLICREDETLFKSTAQIKLTKKNLKDTEAFIKEHNFSPEFVDIPGNIFDKCVEKAFETGYKEYPDLADKFGTEEEVYVDLEQYMPVSLIMLLSDEVKRKMLTDAPYYMTESEIFPSAENPTGTAPEKPVPDTEKVQPQKGTAKREEKENTSHVDEVQEEEAPNKNNTLYLPIKQIYFDQILAGTKKEEYREIKPTTYKKYLECDKKGNPYFDTSLMDINHPLCGDIYAWNEGNYPYLPKENYLYLHLAVGYHKERDEATVEIEDITFSPLLDDDGKPYRFVADEDGKVTRKDDGELCVWVAVFHLGKIVEVSRAKDR